MQRPDGLTRPNQCSRRTRPKGRRQLLDVISRPPTAKGITLGPRAAPAASSHGAAGAAAGKNRLGRTGTGTNPARADIGPFGATDEQGTRHVLAARTEASARTRPCRSAGLPHRPSSMPIGPGGRLTNPEGTEALACAIIASSPSDRGVKAGRETVGPAGPRSLKKGPTMSSEQPGPEPSETAQQINDLFDSAELSKAIETEEFKRFLDYIPIAIVVSKHFRGDQRICYANRLRNSPRRERAGLRKSRPG